MVWFWTEPVPLEPYPMWIKGCLKRERKGQPTRPKKGRKRTPGTGHWRTSDIYANEWKVAFASVSPPEKKNKVDNAVVELHALSLENTAEPQTKPSVNK